MPFNQVVIAHSTKSFVFQKTHSHEVYQKLWSFLIAHPHEFISPHQHTGP